MRSVMKYEKLIQGVGDVLKEKYSSEEVKTILKEAQERCEALFEENKEDSKALREHTFKRVYPGIAMYETLTGHDISSDDAVWYIREYFQRYCARVMPYMRKLIALPGVAKRFPKFFHNFSMKSFSVEAGFEYEFPDTTGNESRFSVIKCPYMEACKRYGCTEIVKAFCDSDDASYGDLHRDLHWGRTKTIGHDGDCCDFLLQYVKRWE